VYVESPYEAYCGAEANRRNKIVLVVLCIHERP
jgi:hypothetical protein